MKKLIFLVFLCPLLEGYSQTFEQSVFFEMNAYQVQSLPGDCQKMIQNNAWWKNEELTGKIELLVLRIVWEIPLTIVGFLLKGVWWFKMRWKS